MKKNVLLTMVALFGFTLNFAQISTLPHTQSFTAPFENTGNNVYFYPNYFGNEVQTSSRIFRDATVFNSAPAALAITPTGSFDGEVIIEFNLTAYSSVVLDFVAKSVQNGDGTRPTKLTIETSIDNGTTWIGSQEIGQFPNETQAEFTAYTYALPVEANNQSNVKVKLFGSTGDGGSGTRARLVLDDLSFAVSNVPQISVGSSNLSFNQVLGIPSSAQAVSASGSNLTSDVNLTVASPFEISLSETSGYTTSVSLSHTDGILNATDVYVRLNSTSAGSFTGTLTVASTGASTSEVSLTGNTTASTISAPAAFDLSGGNYTFTGFDEDSPIETYPDNIIFWTHDVTDPSSDVLFMENYGCLYNLGSRSRINGLGADGVSLVNTGNSQFVGVCDGSDPEQNSGETLIYGRNGAIVLALNTLGRQDVKVDWTGRTINQNNRVYSLKLQYKIGNDSLNSGWVDVIEDGAAVEYVSGETGTSASFETLLPAAVNNNPVVLVRWVYNHVETGVTGSRAELALDDVTVSSEIYLNVSDVLADTFNVYPNPVTNTLNINSSKEIKEVNVLNISGQIVSKTKGSTVDFSNLPKGIYLVKVAFADGKVQTQKVIKK